MGEMKVKVAVRIRPLLPKEILHNHQVCVRVLPNTPQVILGNDRTFTFDFTFGPKSQQDQVYYTCVKPLVASLMDGYNVTVFAYGQTGSGKTYTIGGSNITSSTESERGIIPHAIQDIFQHIEEKHNSDFTVKASYIEVYKEELRDLLELDTSSKDMHIREDEKGNTVLVGARENLVESVDQLMSVLQAGNAARHTGPTRVNDDSSRSHAVFTIFLTRHDPDDGCTVSSKFHLVDLAGSERAGRMGNTGQRLQESALINSGLLALGNVIRALGDPRRRTRHVPYRDAKVTRLLKDSLGGNAQTLVITCVSPSTHSLHETLSSLKFANRARAIHNLPVVNQHLDQERLGQLEMEVQTLREALRDGGRTRPPGGSEQADDLARCQQELLKFRRLAQGAFQLLLDLRESDLNGALSSTNSRLLQEWLQTYKVALNQKSTSETGSLENTAVEPYYITIMQLRQELRKCQDSLAMDEQIFSQKESQLKELQAEMKRLEQESQEYQRFLQEERNMSRLQNEKLEEQQLLIDRLRNDLMASRTRTCVSEASVDVGGSEPAARRPYSVPLISQPRRDSCGHDKAGNRKVHTSPPAYSLERVMAAFKTRSQLLLAQIEEKDEVLAQDIGSDSDEEEDDTEEKEQIKGLKRAMNRTWTRQLSPDVASRKRPERPLPPRWGAPPQVLPPADYGANGIGPRNGLEATEELSLKRTEAINLQCLREAELRYDRAHRRIKELALNIRLKEELIKELVKTGSDAQAVNRHYAMKISQLEQEIKQSTSERRNVKGEQENSQRPSVKEQYLPRALVALSWQTERSRVDLERSVELMREQSDHLQQQLVEEVERKRSLQARISKDKQKIRELQQRHRELESGNAREDTASCEMQQHRTSNVQEQRLEEQQHWLDQAEEKVLQQRQTLAELQEELSQRKHIVSCREAFSQERSHLEMKKLNSSQALNRDLLRVSTQLAAVDQELQEKTVQLQATSVEVRASLSQELGGLQQERELLHRRRDSLEQKLKDGSVLTVEEEHTLFQLEEGLEALDAAIEYKNHMIKSAKKLLKESSQTVCSSEESIMGKLGTLSYAEVKALLLKYFNKVVNLREAERRLQLRCEDLELQANEQEGVVRELEGALQRLSLETDRRLMEQQRQHQHSMQLLLQDFKEGQSSKPGENMKAKEEKIQQLEKDLFFYKMTSRELRKKLKELVTDSQSQPNLPGEGRHPRQAADSPSRASKESRDDVIPGGELQGRSEGDGGRGGWVRIGSQAELLPSCHSSRQTRLKVSAGSFQEDSIELSQKTD
ncbi:kinesin-like protein KIF27 isoform X2 [Brienomyrus brachyistius]|uniref:kinesin-like protein KIF27 isoform X2 n=1 Tax=Brienomyrus brachyistius TaxID=42636 RepID=UPI0020B237F1|nr:kinesin-like protein KIF27 isoform X2 [Brienomyrus brachyistius]